MTKYLGYTRPSIAERLRGLDVCIGEAHHPDAMVLAAHRTPELIINTPEGRQWLIYGEVVVSTGPYGTSLFLYDDTSGIGSKWVVWGAARVFGWPWNWFRDPCKRVFEIVDRMNADD